MTMILCTKIMRQNSLISTKRKWKEKKKSQKCAPLLAEHKHLTGTIRHPVAEHKISCY
jgi:hypothetical protein